MDLKVPWKALSKQDAPSSKWGAFSVKQIAFFALVGLAVVVGIVLRLGHFFGEPGAEQNAPVTVAAPQSPAAAPALPAETTESQVKTPPTAQESGAPNEQAGQAGQTVEQAGQSGETTEQPDQTNGAAVEQAEQPQSPSPGPILVSRQPIAMLASPSSSAPTLYGFPAGRPFRVIGHQGGFAQIKDLRSGATGWIDEAALAPAPGSPAVSSPSQPKPVATSRKSSEPSTAQAPKPKAPKKDTQVTAGSGETTEPAQAPRRPGLFGGGGLFGGIFGGGNGNAN